MNDDEASVLDMLFGAYSEHDHEESDTVKQGFYELDSLLKHFPEEMIDPVMYTVCDLCHAHERKGFLMGVRVGIRLLRSWLDKGEKAFSALLFPNRLVAAISAWH